MFWGITAAIFMMRGVDTEVLLQRKRFWAEVDLNAARNNFEQIRNHLIKQTKLCCVW